MITAKRGDIWLADLKPTVGSEQSGIRPVLIFQHDMINKFTTTVLTIPLTANLKRAALPSCVLILKGEGGLDNDSVALCHQLRVLDKVRLRRKLGMVSSKTITTIESCVMFTMGIV